jgi:NADPH-dependent curcumin reductase CurA
VRSDLGLQRGRLELHGHHRPAARLVPAHAECQEIGFIVGRPAWDKRYPEALARLAGWVASGQIEVRETVVEGLESAPKAFLNLFDGSNTGKIVVKVASKAQ